MSGGDKESIRVLFVDDEADFVQSMSKALSRRGFEVTGAPDGRAALEILASQAFDVILLDVKMPGLDGDAVFREVRRMRLDTPVVVLTGHGSVKQAFDLSKEGVFEYLAKPCDAEELAGVLRRAASAAPTVSPARSPVPTRVLLSVGDPDSAASARLEQDLRSRGLDVVAAGGAQAAFSVLRESVVDVVVMEPEDPPVMVMLKRAYPLVEVIVLVPAHAGVLASELLKAGAFDVLEDSVGAEALSRRIHAARDRRRERLEQDREKRVREILERQPD